MPFTDRERLLELASRTSYFSAADVEASGIHSQQLTRLVEEGLLERIARGQYRWVEAPLTKDHGLVVASRAIPKGVVCLLSALSFHGIGTQLPPDVWVAMEPTARVPETAHLPLRIVRFGGAAFSKGVVPHTIEGQTVRIYGVAKTLADLFKFRNKIGLDIALEALREAWQDRRFTMQELDRAASVCRVERVMKPYLEALLS